LPAELIDHGAPPFIEPADAADPISVGSYLVSSAGCRGCHGPDLTGAGGAMPNASNLTPVGLDGWSEMDFKVALRQGRRPNGTELVPEMPRAFGAMSDEDLHLVFEYLKSLP